MKHATRLSELDSSRKILVGNCENNRPLGRRRRIRLNVQIKINLKEIECDVVDRLFLARNKN
jgi:hypothetical protein